MAPPSSTLDDSGSGNGTLTVHPLEKLKCSSGTYSCAETWTRLDNVLCLSDQFSREIDRQFGNELSCGHSNRLLLEWSNPVVGVCSFQNFEFISCNLIAVSFGTRIVESNMLYLLQIVEEYAGCKKSNFA